MIDNNSKVLSIIIPVYNVEKYLDECLESVIKNYNENIEVILVDDGSKDNSGNICDKYTKEYEFISVIHKENGGLSSARNAGIKKANGKYIWFVDSDDYISDDSISNILEKSKSNPDLIIGNYATFYSKDKKEVYQDFEESSLKENMLPYEYFNYLGNVSYAAVRFIAKRKLIIDNDLFFTEGIYHEDEEWTPRVLCVAKTFAVILPLIYNYRVGNPNSIIGMLNTKKVLDKIFISKSIYDRIRKNNLPKDMREFLESRIAHNYIAALHESCKYTGEDKKKVVKELKDNKYLLDGINNKKAKIVRYSINLIGITQTAKLLVMKTKFSKGS